MSHNALILQERLSAMIEVQSHENEERSFGEFRRKVRVPGTHVQAEELQSPARIDYLEGVAAMEVRA